MCQNYPIVELFMAITVTSVKYTYMMAKPLLVLDFYCILFFQEVVAEYHSYLKLGAAIAIHFYSWSYALFGSHSRDRREFRFSS